MNHEHNGLKKLKSAFTEINHLEYESLKLDSLAEVIPSARYIKRMEKLIARQKQPYWKFVNTAAKRIAMIAIAIILTFSLSMSVEAVRKSVSELLVNVYEKFVEFFYNEEDIAKSPNCIETVYTLGYVPEGYILKSCDINKLHSIIVWDNVYGNEIVFSQGLLHSFGHMDNENSNYEIIYIDNMAVAYIEKQDNQYLYWNSNDYRFSLLIPKDISLECIKMIIESITGGHI